MLQKQMSRTMNSIPLLLRLQYTDNIAIAYTKKDSINLHGMYWVNIYKCRLE